MRPLIIFACLAPFLVPECSLAQDGFDGTSSTLRATGTSEITVRPELLQMSIQIEGRSSDLPQAVTELKRRVEVAREKLKQLGASDGSVIVGKPQIQGSNSPEQAQQMQAMLEQYGGGERGQQMLEQTQSVSIIQTVAARWPLAGKDDMQRLISTKELTDKIRAADVASNADPQPVTAAQEELAAEMAAMIEEYSYGEETTITGEPEFEFVARLGQEKYRESLSIAFEKAARQIVLLSEIGKSKISNPLAVSSSISTVSAEDYYGVSSELEPKEDPQSGIFEWIANDPIEAKCIVTVTAVSSHK